jgi:hypothetical protein
VIKMRRWALTALGCLALAALGLAGCATEEVADPAAAQAAEDLAWLKENKPILEARRQELQEIRDRLAGKGPAGEEAAAGEEGETAAGEGEAPTPEELEARATVLADEIETLSGDLGQRVVSYLNNATIVAGAELTADQQFGIDVKISEDMVIAQEYVDKGGDYGKALEIYRQIRMLDPDHQALNAAVAQAEANRWMTEERFARVKKRMTQDEVRELLGQVMLNNLREYPDRGVVGWFYRKEDGGAAAVFFREKTRGRGDWQVYDANFNAVSRQVLDGGEGEGEES